MDKHWHPQLQLHLRSTWITVPLRKAMMLLLLKQGIQFIKNIKNNSFCLACTQTAKLAGVSYETDVSPFSPPLTSLIPLGTVPGLLITVARTLTLDFFFLILFGVLHHSLNFYSFTTMSFPPMDTFLFKSLQSILTSRSEVTHQPEQTRTQ